MRTHASGIFPTQAHCLGGRWDEIKAGGFSGPLLCEDQDASFKLIGIIHLALESYMVYDYRYKFKPPDGSVLHGGQRVIIFNSNGKYLGQYAITPPPQFDITIRGTSIVISSHGKTNGVIEFKNQPPLSALVDGELIKFFK
jgi:hypothetical protein